MVQITTTALLTVAQVALYSTSALGGPIDLTGNELEARSGTAGRIALEMGKDHAKSKAAELALQWKDQTFNKRPNMPSVVQQAMAKHKKEQAGGHHPAPKGQKPPPLPAAQKKPSIAEQAKHAADNAKKHPVQTALKKQRRDLEYDLEERDFDELYDRDLDFDLLEARSGTAGRVVLEMGKDHAKSKAAELALQWKDQTFNKRPNMASVVHQAMDKQKKEKAAAGGHHSAPKPPALPTIKKKPSIAEQAKQAADHAKKHPVQAALRKQRRSLDFDLDERDLDELYDLAERDLDFELEARSGVGGRIALEMGKDHAKSKAAELALQWKDQTFNKRPNMPSIVHQAMEKNKKDKAAGQHSASTRPNPPALPAAHKKPSIAAQAKSAADAAKKHPVQAALRRQRRALEYELAERDLESLYDLVTRDLYFDMLEERSGPMDGLD